MPEPYSCPPIPYVPEHDDFPKARFVAEYRFPRQDDCPHHAKAEALIPFDQSRIPYDKTADGSGAEYRCQLATTQWCVIKHYLPHLTAPFLRHDLGNSQLNKLTQVISSELFNLSIATQTNRPSIEAAPLLGPYESQTHAILTSKLTDTGPAARDVLLANLKECMDGLGIPGSMVKNLIDPIMDLDALKKKARLEASHAQTEGTNKKYELAQEIYIKKCTQIVSHIIEKIYEMPNGKEALYLKLADMFPALMGDNLNASPSYPDDIIPKKLDSENPKSTLDALKATRINLPICIFLKNPHSDEVGHMVSITKVPDGTGTSFEFFDPLRGIFQHLSAEKTRDLIHKEMKRFGTGRGGTVIFPISQTVELTSGINNYIERQRNPLGMGEILQKMTICRRRDRPRRQQNRMRADATAERPDGTWGQKFSKGSSTQRPGGRCK